MNVRIKNILLSVVAVVVLICGGISMLNSDLEHIEDTNGPEDYSLATITDEDIISNEMGSLNVSKSTGLLNNGITFSSKKFTGIYRVFLTNFLFNSDFMMDVAGFYVHDGNFRMVIVNEGKIIAEVEPDMFAECRLQDLNGSFELIIAGESAGFEFTLDKSFCEQYNISVG